jgi:hypothetical protein
VSDQKITTQAEARAKMTEHFFRDPVDFILAALFVQDQKIAALVSRVAALEAELRKPA